MKNLPKNLIFWLIAGTIAFVFLQSLSEPRIQEELTYSEFKQEVKSKKVKSIVYKGD